MDDTIFGHGGRFGLGWIAAIPALGALLIFSSGTGCDFGPREWETEENVYERQDEFGNSEEGGVGWQDLGQSMGSGTAASGAGTGQSQVSFEVEKTLAPGTGGGGGQGSTLWKYRLQYSDIVLAPDGTAIWAMIPLPGAGEGFANPGLGLAVMPLPFGKPIFYPHIRDVLRVNFSPDGKQAYILESGGRGVSVIDVKTWQVVAKHLLDGTYSTLEVTGDNRFLVAGNLPRGTVEQKNYLNLADCISPQSYGLPEGTSLCRLGMVDQETGHSWSTTLPRPVRDVDYLVGDKEMIFTYGFRIDATEGNRSVLRFYSPLTKKAGKELLFPNCADELVIVPGEATAVLSPTWCAFVGAEKVETEWQTLDPDDPKSGPAPGRCEPISVIDLKTRTFVLNTPGFGPVAVSPDGTKAVGFTRKNLLETQFNYFGQSTSYGLVIVDLATRAWKVVEMGNGIPAFTVSPDSKNVVGYSYYRSCVCHELVSGAWGFEFCQGESYDLCRESCCAQCCEEFEETMLSWFDFATLSRSETPVPLAPARRLSWSADGKSLFGLWDDGLRRLKRGTEAEPLATSFLPDLLKVRPQGDYLVLAPADSPRFHLYEPGEGKDVGVFDLNILDAEIEEWAETGHAVGSAEAPPRTATAIRLVDETPLDSGTCTDRPGADLAWFQLYPASSFLGSSSWTLERTGGSVCEDNAHSDPFILPAVDSPSSPWVTPDQFYVPASNTPVLSLNGGELSLTMIENVVITSGDALFVAEWDPGEEDGPDDMEDSLTVEVWVTDPETGKSEWVRLPESIDGPTWLNLDF